MDLLKFALDMVISLFPVFIIIHLIVYVSGRKYVPEQSKLQRQETYLSYIHIPKSFPDEPLPLIEVGVSCYKNYPVPKANKFCLLYPLGLELRQFLSQATQE